MWFLLALAILLGCHVGHREAAGWDELLAARPGLPLDAEHTDVLLVIPCTLRRDRLEPYGAGVPTSPFLAAVARHGLLFEHAFAQAPWTRPSVASLVTGTWPGVLQVDDPSDRASIDRALPGRFTTLAERLSGAGYATLGASGNPNASRLFGFAQGFDYYRDPGGLIRDGVPVPRGDELVDALLAELDRLPPEQRVYLQLVLVETHAPRHPSAASLALLRRAEPEPPGPHPELLLPYDASVRDLDAVVGRLYRELRRRRPNLLFALHADHGEGLSWPPAHGPGHGNHLYATTTEVPFLLHHPALPQGRAVRGLVSGVDLAPTLLDLLGLPHGGMDGRSLRPALESGRSERLRAFSETYFRRSDRDAVVERVDGELWHLLRDRRTGREELYALSDGLEVRDRAAERPELVDELGARLDDWEREVRRRARASGPPVEVRPGAAERGQLEALGYLEER